MSVDEAFARVYEDERDVPALRGLDRTQLREVLDALPLPPLAAQARRVDQDELRVPAFEHGVDRVPRRPGSVGDDHAVLTDELVQQARLPHVRPAENGHPNGVLTDLVPRLARKLVDDAVEQVAS
jgi:hypothetical protein